MVKPLAIVMVNTLVAVTLLASDTWTVKLTVPPDVGVPLIVPVLPPSVSPFGGAPTVIDHENGAVPPVAPNVTGEYDTPTVPLGNMGAVLIVGPGTMVIENDFVSEPPRLSVTLILKVNGPEAVGVPLIVAVLPLTTRLSPPGKTPEATVQILPPEPPDELNGCE